MRKGFTLIEVLVVAVIVAILAAVAIPAYMSYVEDSKGQVMESMGATVATAIGNCIASSRQPSSAFVDKSLTDINAALGTAYAIKGINTTDLTITTTDDAQVQVVPGTGTKFKGGKTVLVVYN